MLSFGSISPAADIANDSTGSLTQETAGQAFSDSDSDLFGIEFSNLLDRMLDNQFASVSEAKIDHTPTAYSSEVKPVVDLTATNPERLDSNLELVEDAFFEIQSVENSFGIQKSTTSVSNGELQSSLTEPKSTPQHAGFAELFLTSNTYEPDSEISSEIEIVSDEDSVIESDGVDSINSVDSLPFDKSSYFRQTNVKSELKTTPLREVAANLKPTYDRVPSASNQASNPEPVSGFQQLPPRDVQAKDAPHPTKLDEQGNVERKLPDYHFSRPVKQQVDQFGISQNRFVSATDQAFQSFGSEKNIGRLVEQIPEAVDFQGRSHLDKPSTLMGEDGITNEVSGVVANGEETPVDRLGPKRHYGVESRSENLSPTDLNRVTNSISKAVETELDINELQRPFQKEPASVSNQSPEGTSPVFDRFVPVVARPPGTNSDRPANERPADQTLSSPISLKSTDGVYEAGVYEAETFEPRDLESKVGDLSINQFNSVVSKNSTHQSKANEFLTDKPITSPISPAVSVVETGENFENRVAVNSSSIEEVFNPSTIEPFRASLQASDLSKLETINVIEKDVFGVTNQIKDAILGSGVIPKPDLKATSSIYVHLVPQNLGELAVEVTSDELNVKVRIIAEQTLAHLMIEQHVDQLVDSLRDSTERTVDVEVFHQDTGQSNRDRQEEIKQQKTKNNNSDHANGNVDQATENSLPADTGVDMVV